VNSSFPECTAHATKKLFFSYLLLGINPARVGAWLAGGSATCVCAHGRRAGGACMRVVDVYLAWTK
jgi:hypothetical protein